MSERFDLAGAVMIFFAFAILAQVDDTSLLRAVICNLTDGAVPCVPGRDEAPR